MSAVAAGQSRWGRRVMSGLAIGAVIIWLAPVLWLANISLKTQAQIYVRTPTFWFQPTGENYFAALTQFGLLEEIGHSLIIASGTTMLTILLATMMSYGFTRFRFPARGPVLVWILTLRMLPPIAVVIPFYVIYNNAGLIDTFWGLIVAYLPITVPFALWLIYSFARNVPIALDEAAALDGSSHWQTFRNIFLPLMLPAIAVTAIFIFLEVWNDFLLAFILTGVSTKTVAIGMSEFITEHAVLWGPMSAASILLIAPLLLIVYFLQRYMVEGLTLGAVR